MSKRSDRREAERLARKLACQTQKAMAAMTTGHIPAPASTTQAAAPSRETTFMPFEPKALAAPATEAGPQLVQSQTFETQISDAQVAANRANSRLSTGPITAEGKAISSRNALKTGLTGRTVLLPSDDPAHYQLLLDRAIALHQPAGDEEQALVQSIVDANWRLDRVVNLETGIYTKGLLELADKFHDQQPARRSLLIQTETYLKYEKSLRNLNIQEARLRRQLAKDTAELKRLKDERLRRDMILQAAAKRAALSSTNPVPVAAQPANGFEFANAPAAFYTKPATAINGCETEADRG